MKTAGYDSYPAAGRPDPQVKTVVLFLAKACG